MGDFGNVRDPNMIIPEKLLNDLKEKFPNRLPTESTKTLPEIMFQAGAASVISYLESHNTQRIEGRNY